MRSSVRCGRFPGGKLSKTAPLPRTNSRTHSFCRPFLHSSHVIHFGIMPSHSFKQWLQSTAALLSLLPELAHGWLTGSCTQDFGSQDVLRIELNSNIWTSNTTLSAQRGAYIWVGNQEWRMDVNSAPSALSLPNPDSLVNIPQPNIYLDILERRLRRTMS